MALTLNVNISPLGGSSSNYTVRWRIFGTPVWQVTSISPPNPISSSILASAITVPTDNTIYEVQIVDNCGTNVAYGSIIRIIDRGCPTLSSLAITTTDTTVMGFIPLNTPLPVNNHISSIVASIFIGATLINTQTISSVSQSNAFGFTGLVANTNYNLVIDINYAQSDTIPYSYSLGDTPTLHKCLTNSFTTAAPVVCPTPVITSITQS